MTYKVFLEGTDTLIQYANVKTPLTCGERMPIEVDGEDAIYQVIEVEERPEMLGDRVIHGRVWVRKS